MRNDEAQCREAAEQIAFQQLHEGNGISRNIVSARRVHRRVARSRNVDHRRNVQFHHLFIEREPVFVRQRRMGKAPAARIGVQVAPDKAKLIHAALKLDNGTRQISLRRLRQHAHACKRLGIKAHNARNQVVARLRPLHRYRLIAHMRGHRRCARRKDRHIRAALFQQAQLVRFNRLAYLVVRNLGVRRALGPRLERSLLLLAPFIMRLGQHGIMAVAVDDHGHATLVLSGLKSMVLPACSR